MDYDLPDQLPGTASGPDSFGYNFLDELVKGPFDFSAHRISRFRNAVWVFGSRPPLAF